VSRATHHENESASQILVAGDLTAVPAVKEPRKEHREKAKSCVHITSLSTFQRASFPLAGFLLSGRIRLFKRETADALRKTGAILWENGMSLRKSYDKRLLEKVWKSNIPGIYQTVIICIVRRLVVCILMKSHFTIVIFKLWILRVKSFASPLGMAAVPFLFVNLLIVKSSARTFKTGRCGIVERSGFVENL